MPPHPESSSWPSCLAAAVLGAACVLAVRAASAPPPPAREPDPAAPFGWAELSSRTLRARRLAAIHRALARGETRYQFTVEDPLPPMAAGGK